MRMGLMTTNWRHHCIAAYGTICIVAIDPTCIMLVAMASLDLLKSIINAGCGDAEGLFIERPIG